MIPEERHEEFYIISSTDSYVYKLSDFRTAKPLKDRDFFQSLVGTEEYLVNKIYITLNINLFLKQCNFH